MPLRSFICSKEWLCWWSWGWNLVSRTRTSQTQRNLLHHTPRASQGLLLALCSGLFAGSALGTLYGAECLTKEDWPCTRNAPYPLCNLSRPLDGNLEGYLTMLLYIYHPKDSTFYNFRKRGNAACWVAIFHPHENRSQKEHPTESTSVRHWTNSFRSACSLDAPSHFHDMEYYSSIFEREKIGR